MPAGMCVMDHSEQAPQTDFHVKPDNSSGLIYDNPSERPLRTKVTFQPKQAPKSSEESHVAPNRERTDQAKQRTNSPPCSEPWRKLRIIRSDSMAQHCRHRRLRSLVYRDSFPSLSLERKILAFFPSLCISTILSTTIPIYIYIELQFLQWPVAISAVGPLQFLQWPVAISAVGPLRFLQWVDTSTGVS